MATSEIAAVKRDVDITEVLGHLGIRVPFRQGWVSCKCPFHNDHQASAAANVTLGKFRCHGCDARGDVIDLAKLYLDTADIKEAISWLKQTFSVGQ